MDLAMTPNAWLKDAKKNAGWLIALGAVSVIVGMLAIGSPMVAGMSVSIFVGVMLLISGIGHLVGGRWIWNFGKQWQLVGRGDIGGFGVGSDFTWNASGLLVWQPWKHVALAAGYRGLYQDYENGSGADRYKWDVTMHGPLAGIDFRW